MGNVNTSGGSTRSSSTGGSSRRTGHHHQQQQQQQRATSVPNHASSVVPESWTSEWHRKEDERLVTQLAQEGKMAPRAQKKDGGKLECPICFFSFERVNSTKCCSQPICTDCFVEVRRKSKACPFCSRDDFGADCYVKVKSADTGWNARNELHFAVAPQTPSHNKVHCVDYERAMDDAADERKVDEEKKDYSFAAPSAKPLSSIEERDRIESEMRRQLEEARKRGDSPAAPAPPTPATSTGLGVTAFSLSTAHRRRARARAARLAAENGDLTFDDIHALLNALPTDLHQVEELMVLEAMQASLEEEETRRQRQEQEESLLENADDDASAPSNDLVVDVSANDEDRREGLETPPPGEADDDDRKDDDDEVPATPPSVVVVATSPARRSHDDDSKDQDR
mmetsp:Transcript_12006/g.36099  ORF Transcript_12006/g.36099 Transcript_12006/m.36099 type:complete len:397 (+) Transcript_12006:143-1333(+)|eukprot:CAMPEP_0198665828 /NCGR_PEP_ID=MMETSP1467-20131203/62240_1 /TAXON_ID=1462469 /ORGANISM="unid. sp., Strain CCMP2135" /LENGTH=396 /DNA_ID=CAMNT_0044402439 /DNA_START=120 /DNA_END=1310 /DNA_ORIENTATION=+